jgi:acetoin utilization deacetylase AcuC-like enzyme
MTLLYYSPTFLEHDTGQHPENPRRIVQAAWRLLDADAAARFVRPEWQPASMERLVRVHSAEYLETVRQFAAAGGGQIEADTVVSPPSFDVARLAAGAVCDAVQRVVRGEDTQAFCLIRPPGHHALPTGAMGFCLLGNVAIAARVATGELGLDRVLIVDWDVHHGNGTQDMFWEDPQVGFFSIHRYPFYPGTGAADETGAGRGLGTTLNVPVAFGTPRREFLAAFTTAVERFADRIKPQLVILSAGFDAHREDPVGSLGLESEDFEPLARVVRDIAAVHAGGRIVSVLEGGYHPQAVAESALAHLQGLSESNRQG